MATRQAWLLPSDMHADLTLPPTPRRSFASRPERSRSPGRPLAGALLAISTTAHAQFGGSSPSDETTFLLLGLPWLVLIAAIVTASQVKSLRSKVGPAVWRTVKVYCALMVAFFVLAIVFKLCQPDGLSSGVMLFAMLMLMGVMFSGLVLCVMFAIAMAYGVMRGARGDATASIDPAEPDRAGESA